MVFKTDNNNNNNNNLYVTVASTVQFTAVCRAVAAFAVIYTTSVVLSSLFS